MWYQWANLKDFDLWHKELCSQLSYPITPVNQASGEADDDAQKVVAYTSAIQVDGKVIAWVDNEFSIGLVKTDLRPIDDNPMEA